MRAGVPALLVPWNGDWIFWKRTRLSSWVCPGNQRDQGSALIGSALPGTTSPCSQHQPGPPCPPQGLCQTAPACPAGNCSPWMHSRLQISQDRSNLSTPAWQSWRKPRQEHSCLTHIVNILQISCHGASSPFLCGFSPKMVPLLLPKQPSAAEPTRAGGHRAPVLPWGHLGTWRCPEGTQNTAQSLGVHPQHFGLPRAGSSTEGCRGGDAQPPSGLVEQKCRILPQIQSPAGRGVRGNSRSLERAKEREKPTQERGPEATAPPEQGTPFTPLTGTPSLGSAGFTGS